jgi:Gpi18-like mannosyltransferase
MFTPYQYGPDAMVKLRKPDARAEVALLAVLVALAVLARWAGRDEKTADMRIFFQWYGRLKAAGGWRGLGQEIGNYNAPFLYLLTLAVYLPGPLILKIKAIWVVFDVVLAFVAYRIVGLRFPGRRIPAVAALIMVLLPTVVINASFYGQMDSMWAAAALGGVYCLIRDKPWWGVALCTVALAVKPQGIFIFPLLLMLLLAGRLPWRTLLAVPAVFLALDLPALLLGRDPIELFTVYDLSRQAVHVPALSLRAPSVYAFIPATTRVDSVRTLGYVLAAALLIGVCYALVVRGVALTAGRIVGAAALFAIGTPFVLPGMHDRYFYLADVTTLVLAFYRPRLWFVPLLVQAGSLLSYEEFLFGANSRMLPEVVPATLMLAALITVAHHLLTERCDVVDAVPDPPRAVIACAGPVDSRLHHTGELTK